MKYNLWKREPNKYWFEGFNIKPKIFKKVISILLIITIFCLIPFVTFHKEPIQKSNKISNLKLYKLDDKTIKQYNEKYQIGIPSFERMF